MDKATKHFLLLVFVLLALNACAAKAQQDYGEAFHQSGHAGPAIEFCEKVAEIGTCLTITSPKACQRLLDMANPGHKLDLTLPAMMDSAEAGDFVKTEPEANVTRVHFEMPDSMDAMTDGSDGKDTSIYSFIDMAYNPGDRSDIRLGSYYSDHAAGSTPTPGVPHKQPPQYTVPHYAQMSLKAAPKTSYQDNFIDPRLLADTTSSQLPSYITSKAPDPQPAPPALLCHVCQRPFAQRALLQTHIRHQHSTAPKRYHCPHPGCVFSAHWPKDVNRHKAVHTQSRQFRCRTCEKQFSRQDNFLRHAKLKKHDRTPADGISTGRIPQ